MSTIKENREFLKANFKVLDNIKTDKQKGLPCPNFQKEYNSKYKLIDLPKANENVLVESNIFKCIDKRRSLRHYSKESISLSELSYLLWATQGIQKVKSDSNTTLRTVPSAGATHTFETYLIINNVENLENGIYRYIPLEHKLLFMSKLNNMEKKVDEATPRQPFVANFVSKSGVIFLWSSTPYRAEYRFHITAHKKILIDVGHVCQNLSLASESINCGACAIGIYDQDIVDKMLDLDGEEEFIIYMAAVGRRE